MIRKSAYVVIVPHSITVHASVRLFLSQALQPWRSLDISVVATSGGIARDAVQADFREFRWILCGRQTDRQADRQTERVTDIEI